MDSPVTMGRAAPNTDSLLITRRSAKVLLRIFPLEMPSTITELKHNQREKNELGLHENN